MRILSIDLPTGVRLEFAEHGDLDGRPVLLLHGYSDSWRSFERVLPHLPPSIRAIAATLRGHGDSDRPAAGYATSDLAADAVALLDALGVSTAVVAGHSMGAGVAQRIALDHPARVDGLVLAGCATSWARVPAIAEELAGAVAELDDPIDRVFAHEFQASTVAGPVDAGLLETAAAESCKLPARVWRAVLDGTLLADFAAELPSIAAPTLLVWGDQDGDISPRAEQDALAAAIPGSELIVYEGIGHAVHWERPKRFAADVSAFVSQLSRDISAAPATAR
jgi:non-heme chloroperoxidase